jgi:surfactin synthase thioesterase subunit
LWAAGLPADVEVCAVQLPGRETRLREKPLDRIPDIVEGLLPELRPHLDVPFVLFGHSMGAVIATELCAALAREGDPQPLHLFVSGRRAPHLADPDPSLSHLSDDDFTRELNLRYGGIPAEIMADRELMALLLPCLRADIAALENYRPTPIGRIGFPLTVYGGTQDSRAPRIHLEAWQEMAGTQFRVRQFEGTHFYINPRRAELLADIAATLAPLVRSLKETRADVPEAVE